MKAITVSLPLESCELKLLHTVKQKALQVCFTDSSDWVDVCTGAVVLSKITSQAEKDNRPWASSTQTSGNKVNEL